MSKKITVTLSDKAEAYLTEIMFTLELQHPTKPDELKCPTQSDCINYCLEALVDFEKATDDQLVNWLDNNYKLYSKGKQL